MHLLLINYLPTPIFFIFTILSLILFSFLTYKVLRRFFPSYISKSMSSLIAPYLMITTGTTILIAFFIVMLWQTFLTAQLSVNTEANSLSKIIMNSKMFPTSQQKLIANAVKKYAEIVVNQEWPLMKWGQSSPEAELSLDKIYQALESSLQKSENEQASYKEILSNYNMVLESRNARLNNLESVIPESLFVVIVICLLILAFSICLIEPEEKKTYLLLMLSVNIILGIDLAVIASFDYPFAGGISVSNKIFSKNLIQKI